MSQSLPIYLDYAATTPVAPEVAAAMSETLGAEGAFGNAASATHFYGRRAQALIETARGQVAALIGATPADIVFTSGATEASNLAVLGAARAQVERCHIVTSRIEHKAVLDPCRRLEKEGHAVTWLNPDRDGRIDPQAVRAALRPDTALVTIMHVNNELGVIQDIEAIGALCRQRDILFHTDAAQSAGRLVLDCQALPIDLLSFTAHKLYGPKGVGALFVRRASRPRLSPLSFGGGQEQGLRPGTLATHQIVGFGAACALAAGLRETEQVRLAALSEQLWRGLGSLAGVHLNGAGAPRLANILNVSFEGVEGESLVTGLTSLAVATGSACNSASGEPSYVLRSLGRSSELAQSSLRLSLGRYTRGADIEAAVAAVQREVGRLRAASPQSWAPVAELVSGAPAGTGSEWDPLSPLAREYFRDLPGLGPLAATAAGRLSVVQGEAGGAGGPAWVRFQLATERGTVKDARFQAYGCPHTLAVASWLTRQLPGRERNDLVPGNPEAWSQALGVPIEKLGRLFVVEDALRACLRHWP